MLWEVCWIREGAGVENLIYCCNVHEKDILVAENYAGLFKVLNERGTTVYEDIRLQL